MEGILKHIRWLEARLNEIDMQVVTAMEPYKNKVVFFCRLFRELTAWVPQYYWRKSVSI